MAPAPLAEVVMALERTTGYDKSELLGRVHDIRQKRSEAAWEAFATRAYDLYGDGPPQLDALGAAGGDLDPDFAAKLLEAVRKAPLVQIRREDCAVGYMGETRQSNLDYLNRRNLYHAVTPELMALIDVFLREFAPRMEQMSGHFWSVASVRCFSLRPGLDGQRHMDGWPPSIKKLFLLPEGHGMERGTTYVRLHNGKGIYAQRPGPAWMIFENSKVLHGAVAPKEVPRPTIEVDFMPALHTDTTPRFAGLNGWYPWFPPPDGIEIYRNELKRAVAQAVAEAKAG